tara:strand:+ start:224 stop:1069 length:846 start_codon:yes stop_codon:yes gene_type:complete
MENKDFAIFILTHGRPDNVKTYNVIRNRGYTGNIYIIIDNEDKSAEKYYENFGDKVIMFDKKEIAKTFDEADNFEDRRAIVYARNACFNIAKDLGIKYFMQLDDDYIAFHYRLYYMNKPEQIRNLDTVLELMLNYYKSIPAKTIAMSQGGDFIGGAGNSYATNPKLRRKCMNSFLCSTDRPFKFNGRINEDVNTYTKNASIGELFLTIPILSLTQAQTQSNDGGMTDIYIDKGTYIKSFYSVIFQPSSVKVALMGDKNMRLHHRVSWKHTLPVILEEKHKK